MLARPKLKNADDLPEQVRTIIKAVRNTGDKALKFYSQKFDNVDNNELQLSLVQQQLLLGKLTAERKAAIELAYKNIRAFHAAQLPTDIRLETSPGVVCELKYAAFDSVGLYIPGGSAPLPSTVLMLGVPAQLAGCRRTVLVTPPGQPLASDIAAEIIYAAQLCGIKEIYTVGGAQAVAALAYGTDTIAKVDKIFGPGNRYVTEAKQQVSKDPLGAAIDMPAGPSEVLVIADEFADPAFVAADLLSQAEHGIDSQVVLVSDSEPLLQKTIVALNEQLMALPRAIIAKKAIDHSRFILTPDLATAAQVSNLYAPEHLIVQTNQDSTLVARLTNAASIFVGAWTQNRPVITPAAPTMYCQLTATAVPIPVWGCWIFTGVIRCRPVSQQGMRNIGPAIVTLASAEGLQAHANAVKLRLAALDKQANQQQDFKVIPAGTE